MSGELYSWVPFFSELGAKVLTLRGRQRELISVYNECSGDSPVQDRNENSEFPLEEIDPFTFFALVLKKGRTEARNEIFQRMKLKFGIEAPVPTDYWGVPKPNAQAAWLFSFQDRRDPSDIPALWRVAEAAQSNNIDDELWRQACAVRMNGVAKLSQALFWFFPNQFLPVDAQTRPYLLARGLSPNVDSWSTYQALMQVTKENCSENFCQISLEAYMENQGSPLGSEKIVLTEGAVRNGYIPMNGRCTLFRADHWGGATENDKGSLFHLYLPNGSSVETDLRRSGQSGRIRARLGSLFTALGLTEGSTAYVSKLGDDYFNLHFSPPSGSPQPFELNEELLSLAVEKTIRPYLIDRGELFNTKNEGYHHEKILPVAREALSRESIESNAVLAVSRAIKASGNLLYPSTEQQRPLQFLDRCDEELASEQFKSLLYGDDDLVTRAEHFLEWGDWNNAANSLEGQPTGFNAKVLSYLLNMTDPTAVAFCYPGAYTQAAKALLGDERVETQPVQRIQHATEFYKRALELFRDEHNLPFSDLLHVHIAFWVMREEYFEKEAQKYPSWSQLRESTSTPKPAEPKSVKTHPLNAIFYGPPGTGKTYKTAQRAVEIIDGDAPADRAELMRRYNELRRQNQVFFVTFHQSFSYEEFVEGIRPVLADESATGSGIQYELRDGVFKQACQVASSQLGASNKRYEIPDGTRVWKLSLGDVTNPEEAQIYAECIQEQKIALGWGAETDLTGKPDIASIISTLNEAGGEYKKGDYAPVAANTFVNRMREGDLVVISDGNTKFRAVGRINGPAEFDSNFSYPHVRPVDWLRVFEESLPSTQILDVRFSQMTLYELTKSVRQDALQALLGSNEQDGSQGSGNVVLIIDEINRGNVSKIFGELITLLEPDKRVGENSLNQLRVRLPYSQTEFGVSEKLYVLGTMNTADRSLTHLDTALRRRFVFEELAPDPSLLEPIQWQGASIDVPAMLNAMNERIQALHDREHRIGHAYFMKNGGTVSGEELPAVFRDRVIPLLTEYFFEDWEKVREVLGDNQVNEAQSQFITTAEVDEAFFSDEYSRPDAKTYHRNPEALSNPAAYIKIYQSEPGGNQ